MFAKFNQRFNEHIAIHVDRDQYSGDGILKLLEIQPGAPAITFVGGAAKMNAASSTDLKRAISEGVARAAVELNATVVDCGTEHGTPGMLNDALGVRQHQGLYIGVAPDGLTRLPNHPTNGYRESLGQAHTHFVLVRGDQWGDELETMYAIVNALAKDAPSLGILINGGEGTLHDVEKFVHKDRKQLESEGNGHLADMITLQFRYPGIAEGDEMKTGSRGEAYNTFEASIEPEDLVKKIKQYLKSK